MAEFISSIDDSLAPGIIATASLEGKAPEEVVNEAAAVITQLNDLLAKLRTLGIIAT
jgi:hypothetical protein